MKGVNWLLLMLAVALVTVSVKYAWEKNIDTMENTEIKMTGQDMLDCIMTRASVRTYTDEQISDDLIEKILRAGMAAPSAVNKQPWEFVVVKDSAMCIALADSLKNMHMLAGAPLGIVVCGNLDKAIDGEGESYWIQDCSAVTENMLLAAHAMGLGAVWCGVYPITDRVDYMKKMLEMPENIIPLNMVVFGYPKDETAPKDKWKPENIHLEKY